MLVTADNYFAIAGNCTFNKLIVVRVCSYGYIETLSINELSMNCNQFNNWQYIDRLKFRGEILCNILVFIKDFL
jgi:hypothetical protein